MSTPAKQGLQPPPEPGDFRPLPFEGSGEDEDHDWPQDDGGHVCPDSEWERRDWLPTFLLRVRERKSPTGLKLAIELNNRSVESTCASLAFFKAVWLCDTWCRCWYWLVLMLYSYIKLLSDWCIIELNFSAFQFIYFATKLKVHRLNCPLQE